MNNYCEMMSVLRADLQAFVLTEVAPNLYNLSGSFGGEIYDLAPTCYVSGVEFPLYLSKDRDAAPAGTVKFKADEVHFAGNPMTKCEAVLVRDGEVLQVRIVNMVSFNLVEDLASKEDLREMIDELSTMESWEKRHFLEWVTVQEEAIIPDHGKFAIFGQEELNVWVERYYERDVTMLTDFILENIMEQEVDIHLQVPHPQVFKEFSANHALVPVERQRCFVAGKGDTVVVFNGKTWKIIYVF